MSLVAGVLLAACGDDSNNPVTPPPQPGAAVIDASAPITQSRTLRADTVYTLKGYVLVTNGATLTIEPGTTIKGDYDTPGSSLFITRGAKLIAEGTKERPIVFTSSKPDGQRRPGDWGGIVIVGNATVNRNSGGSAIFTEGPVAAHQNYAGGTDDNDNSGSLRYVRIEFAGYAETVNEELNSLSSYAVGRGTRYEYIESFGGLDDSFEWFGGTVDGSHLVSYESGDDHFDWTEGYRGRNQFLIAYQSQELQPVTGRGTLATDREGFEGDGCETTKPYCVTFAGSTPYSGPVFANFTVIGFGGNFAPASGGYGAVIRRGTGVSLVNGILARWPVRALNIRDQATDTLLQRDSVTIRNLVLVENGTNFDPVGGSNVYAQESKFANVGIQQVQGTAAALFVSMTPGSFDWTPAAASAARTGGMQSFSGTRIGARTTNLFNAGGTIAGTSFIGAADPTPGSANYRWWDGWTRYYTCTASGC